jgi:putative spermidine/putrescine transport system ATP-binding protein
LNVLNGVVVNPAEHTIRIDTQIVRTFTSLAGKMANDQVVLAIRPEGSSLEADTDSNKNHLTGKVESVSFLGAVVRFKVEIANFHLLVDTFNHPHLQVPPIGSNVTVSFPQEACLVLEQPK